MVPMAEKSSAPEDENLLNCLILDWKLRMKIPTSPIWAKQCLKVLLKVFSPVALLPGNLEPNFILNYWLRLGVGGEESWNISLWNAEYFPQTLFTLMVPQRILGVKIPMEDGMRSQCLSVWGWEPGSAGVQQGSQPISPRGGRLPRAPYLYLYEMCPVHESPAPLLPGNSSSGILHLPRRKTI